ncbi:hypothetical protein [Dactylosporangium cerinum]
MVQEWQPDLFDSGPVTSSAQPEVRSPAADASMRARWRALILTDPVARLVRNAAHTGVHQAYDLRQLALAAVDIAVASMGFARQVTLAELIESISELAAVMHPGGAPDDHQDAARWVVKGLLNDADNQGAFVYSFVDALGSPPRREEYAFKLLQLQDGPDGAVVLASHQAVMLYLNGLDLDVDDAEAAFSVVLQRQLRDRRFEAAARTATQAERVSVAMSASSPTCSTRPAATCARSTGSPTCRTASPAPATTSRPASPPTRRCSTTSRPVSTPRPTVPCGRRPAISWRPCGASAGCIWTSPSGSPAPGACSCRRT